MASSENLASMDPWAFRAPFPDSWISEAYARDTETLTKALQKSLSATTTTTTTTTTTADSYNPFLGLLNNHRDTSPPTLSPTASNLSAGSDPEASSALSRRPRTTGTAAAPGPTGKVSKRKSRASKRSQTTFITADPSNFRQMVQQVTGVRFGNSQLPAVPVLRPEPHRPPPGSRPTTGAAYLPTLDTSAFLLDQNQMFLGSVNGPGSAVGPGPLSFSTQAAQTLPVAAAAAAASDAAEFDFDTFCSFPTLESWKVM